MSFQLEMVYCTKGKIKYGPYGPYWYEYWWDRDAEITRCQYVGKYKDDLV